MPYYDDELPEEYAEMGAVMYWKDRAEKAELKIDELIRDVQLITSDYRNLEAEYARLIKLIGEEVEINAKSTSVGEVVA